MFLMILTQVLLTAFDSKVILSKLKPAVPDIFLMAMAIPIILFFQAIKF